MSENAVLAALRRMGYTKKEMTGHGFRSMASTLLHEQGWNHHVIERQLAHAERNAVSAAYSFSARLKEAFCHVAGYSKYVNLGFNRGADLADPSGILAGTGARIRHVRIAAASDLRAPAVQALLRAAVKQGRAAVQAPPKAAASTIRPTTGGKRRPTRTT